MARGLFLYAEKDGKIIHVDSVPNGLDCGCICPHCRRKLCAHQGKWQNHYFAHRIDCGEDKEACYNVTLYKLAEQIIQTKKCIHVPSYYGIFPDKDIEFVDVMVDNNYKKEDKQPDVIATTADGKQYIIEFFFNEKVQHKKPIDYKTLNCLEFDLSGQLMENIEDFLMSESNNKRWLNCDDYFNQIEVFYKKNKTEVKVVAEDECTNCDKFFECRPVIPGLLYFENNGKRYRLCMLNSKLANTQKTNSMETSEENWFFEDKEEDYNDSLTPLAKQDWKTPTEFPCCPAEVRENGLEVYKDNLREGAIFSSNKYVQYYVLDKGISEDGQLIVFAANCEDDGVIGDYALCSVEIKFSKYIHYCIHRFGEKDLATHYFKLYIGEEEWTDEDFNFMDSW